MNKNKNQSPKIWDKELARLRWFIVFITILFAFLIMFSSHNEDDIKCYNREYEIIHKSGKR